MKLSSQTFSIRRRVAFGDCDPARIYYTPRAIDYCVEAVEAWWEEVLQVSWIELLARQDVETSFLRVDCRFLRPLVAGQLVRVKVSVPETGSSHITFRVAGEVESGEVCFWATLVACLLVRGSGTRLPIPPQYRDRIGRYRASCDGGPAVADIGWRGTASPERTGEMPIRENAPLVRFERGTAPEGLFTRNRRVVYGECAASGTVFAPRIFDFAVEAVGEWFEEVLGVSWLELVSIRRQGAPAVAVSCDYFRPMIPGRVVVMAVRVRHVGRASLGFSIAGEDPEGLPLFDAGMTVCFIDQDNGFRSMPIPEEFRGRVQAYRAACGDGG